MSNYTLSQLLDLLWQDYVKTNPPAQHIHNLFTSKGEKVINDHVAFRTFNHSKINVDVLGKVFIELDYVQKGEYQFEKKKLFAKHYEHPDPKMPLVFISQLKTEEFDQDTRILINSLIEQIPQRFTSDQSFLFNGRPWNLSFGQYNQLKRVSEYAAWMAAYGFRANHFTVSINHLKNFRSIHEVNKFLKDNGFKLNDSGGEVKGTPEELLEQSSTIAYNTVIDFSDGSHVVPACYYEFAKRYSKPDGSLFRGFIAGSADKIFESTNKGQDVKM